MKYVYPDYMDDFHCIADRCRHSCCIGWEIDIDEESMERFLSVDGELGKKLRDNISDEPAPHFMLDKDERCPFLEKNGLCELILNLGEDSICDICAEHPRFYNEFDGRIECGIGMCCEEAARLLVNGKEPVRLICSGGDDETPSALITLRDAVFQRLNGAGSFKERMSDSLSLLGRSAFSLIPSEAANFYLTLERMDESWTTLLREMGKHDSAPAIFEMLEDLKYTRIAHYFIFRHFASAEDYDDAADTLIFAFLSAMMVCFLDNIGFSEDALRLYSAEIEYSDENVSLIKRALRRGRLITYNQ